MIDSAKLKQAALDAGFDIAGICPAMPPPHFQQFLDWLAKGRHATMEYMARSKSLRAAPQSLLPKAKSILAVGLNYYQETKSEPPRIARYALGRDYHKVLKRKLTKISNWAKSEYPGLDARPCVDSAPILERDYAQLAGLGWFGKNTCLINSKRGSWFFIGLLLLSEEFLPDSPAEGTCGKCRKCIDACPTGALVFENGREVASLDSSKCISYLTIEHRGDFDETQIAHLNGWLFGCDVCQEVCPFNEPRPHHPLRSAVTCEPDFASRNRPDLESLTKMDDAQVAKAFAGTPFMRPGPAGIRRNASAIVKGPKAGDAT